MVSFIISACMNHDSQCFCNMKIRAPLQNVNVIFLLMQNPLIEVVDSVGAKNRLHFHVDCLK